MNALVHRADRRLALAWRNALVLGLGDAAVLALSLYAGRVLIYWLDGGPLSVRYSLLLLPAWWMGAAAVGLLPSWGLGTVEEMRRIQMLLLSVFALGGLAYFFGRGHFYPSRLAYAAAWLLAAVAMPFVRAGFKWLLIRAKAWGCPVVLYGDRTMISAVAAVLREQPDIGYRPVGVFTDDAAVGERVSDLPVLAGLDGATTAADVAIAPLSIAGNRPLADVFDRALSGYRQVLLLPGTDTDLFLWGRPRALGGLIGMEVTSNLLNPFSRAVKRTVDLAVVIMALPVWLPMGVLIACAIVMADGRNPLYRQDRLGRKERGFRPLKFRTMQSDAEAVLQEALDRDPALRAEWSGQHKLKYDPRVTRVGRLLRRWSLDELPQVVNVLIGEMSLVGPRPLPADHFGELHETTRRLRSKVRPGMTGLWQVSGRSAAGTAGMDRWDAYYVRNWSVWLDFVILVRTFRAVVTGRGAY
jgi:Undecaprenyl-phosphate galactose phosphotransferase WbaP